MKKRLLIVGAGQHGHVVAETAKAIGWASISFLDDHCQEAVGKLKDLEEISKQYDGVVVSIGDNKTRQNILQRLEICEVPVVSIIHPRAFISPTAKIGRGSIILPGATVHTNSMIGDGCILSIGALVDHNTVVGSFCHIDTGAVIGAGKQVASTEYVDAGSIV